MTAAHRSIPLADFDAIVVGSGMTGGWAAKELTELGLRTLVLEAGRPITPEQDYVEHTPPWEMPFRGLGDRRATGSRQSIQSHSGSFDEMSHVFWTDDVKNPYSTPADRPFYWFRARQVGGKSIIWGRQVYRWSNLDFEANLRDGISVDWPIRYADVAPWYDHVERFIGVSGQAEGLAQLPDGDFLHRWRSIASSSMSASGCKIGSVASGCSRLDVSPSSPRRTTGARRATTADRVTGDALRGRISAASTRRSPRPVRLGGSHCDRSAS